MNLAELNNLLNSELTSKIKESKEENGELLINVEPVSYTHLRAHET